jgi:hypothetical protein
MERWVMSAGTVARAGYRAMLRGESIVTPGVMNKLLALGTRASPRIWTAKIARWLQETRNR